MNMLSHCVCQVPQGTNQRSNLILCSKKEMFEKWKMTRDKFIDLSLHCYVLIRTELRIELFKIEMEDW